MPDITDYNKQWRRDTAANLTANNPTPRVGEPIVESDTGQWKLGNGSAWNAMSYQGATLAPGFIFGLETTAAADTDHDVTIATGRCRSSDNTTDMILSSAITKQIDATWAAGDNAGGLFTGTVAADTTYHLFLIFNPTTSTIDAGWDTAVDPTANLPSGYTIYRRIRSYLTDSSSNLIDTIQSGSEFYYKTYINEFNTTTVPTSKTDLGLSIPGGLNLLAKISVSLESTATTTVLVFPQELDDMTVSSTNVTVRTTGGATGDRSTFDILTNSSGQISYKRSGSAPTSSFAITTQGWHDDRGQFDGA